MTCTLTNGVGGWISELIECFLEMSFSPKHDEENLNTKSGSFFGLFSLPLPPPSPLRSVFPLFPLGSVFSYPDLAP